jgi:hypothetical protein
MRHPSMPFAVSLRDVGVGGPDGGFGPLFWGVALPLGVVHALGGRRIVGLQLLAALAPYAVVSAHLLEVTPRYLLAAAVPGFALVACSLDTARSRWPAPAALATALVVLTSALAVMPIAAAGERTARKQLMRLTDVVPENPWRGVEEASYGVGRMARAWDLLEALDGPLWIFATGAYPAGFYGTRLQNRLWNFDAPERPAAPDAFAYVMENADPDRILYYGSPGHRWPEVLAHPERYDGVLVTGDISVYLRRELVAPGGALRERVATYLAHGLPEPALRAAGSMPPIERGTIVSAGPFGHALKVRELTGAVGARVVLARADDVARQAALVREEGPVWVAARAGKALGRIVAPLGDRHSLYEVRP